LIPPTIDSSTCSGVAVDGVAVVGILYLLSRHSSVLWNADRTSVWPICQDW
jgi:hypothetical protein